MRKSGSIKSKLRLGFGVMCLVIILQGVLSTALDYQVQESEVELLAAKNRTIEISQVVSSHYHWLSDLTFAVYNGTEFSGSLDHTTCSLGMWLEKNGASAAEDLQLSYLIAQAQGPHQIIHETARDMLSLSQEGGLPPEAAEEMFHTIRSHSLSTISILEEMESYQISLANSAEGAIVSRLRLTTYLNLSMAVLSILIALLASWLLIRKIVPPIVHLTQAARGLSQGRTDLSIPVESNDEIGQLSRVFAQMQQASREQAELASSVASKKLTGTIIPRSTGDSIGIALNQMVNNMREIIWGITDSSKQIANGAEQMANGAQSLAQGSVEQASAVEQLSETLMEIADKATHNSQTASSAAQLGDEIRSSAQQGYVHMQEMIEAISEIDAASKGINKVIHVVDDLAFQTNLLALNASVEAAHVGIYGTGFAVVADKVRNLATKSSLALQEISELIEDCVSKAQHGVQIATETSSSLSNIVENVVQNSTMIDVIAEYSEDQSRSIHRVSEGIELVSNVVQQNSATAQETAATAQQMYAQSAMLANVIMQFQIDEDAEGEDQALLESGTEDAVENEYAG